MIVIAVSALEGGFSRMNFLSFFFLLHCLLVGSPEWTCANELLEMSLQGTHWEWGQLARDEEAKQDPPEGELHPRLPCPRSRSKAFPGLQALTAHGLPGGFSTPGQMFRVVRRQFRGTETGSEWWQGMQKNQSIPS